jgi:hypothetical protein
MPTSTKQIRASASGTCMGRPASAATATASIEPATSPAGKPISAKASPPAAAISRVSAAGRDARSGDKDGGIGGPEFRAGRTQ